MTKRHEKVPTKIFKIIFFFIIIFQVLPFSCVFFYYYLFYFPKMSNIIVNITCLVQQDQSFYSFIIRNYYNSSRGLFISHAVNS